MEIGISGKNVNFYCKKAIKNLSAFALSSSGIKTAKLVDLVEVLSWVYNVY